jgi:hypothetical protein
MKNLSEHRFDLPSATEPHIKLEQARVLRCEAAEHLGGGCDLVGLRLLLLSQSAPAETDSMLAQIQRPKILRSAIRLP